MYSYITCFLVFFLAFISDGLWAYYIKHTSLNNAFKASISGSLIMLIGGFTTIEYINNKNLLIVAVVGGFLGTYITIKFKRT